MNKIARVGWGLVIALAVVVVLLDVFYWRAG